MDSKPRSLRERTEKATADHIRKELAPVLAEIKTNQAELQSCAQQMTRLLRLQHEPWRKAGAMLWGVVMGALIFALLQPKNYAYQSCVYDRGQGHGGLAVIV